MLPLFKKIYRLFTNWTTYLQQNAPLVHKKMYHWFKKKSIAKIQKRISYLQKCTTYLQKLINCNQQKSNSSFTKMHHLFTSAEAGRKDKRPVSGCHQLPLLPVAELEEEGGPALLERGHDLLDAGARGYGLGAGLLLVEVAHGQLEALQ